MRIRSFRRDIGFLGRAGKKPERSMGIGHAKGALKGIDGGDASIPVYSGAQSAWGSSRCGARLSVTDDTRHEHAV